MTKISMKIPAIDFECSAEGTEEFTGSVVTQALTLVGLDTTRTREEKAVDAAWESA